MNSYQNGPFGNRFVPSAPSFSFGSVILGVAGLVLVLAILFGFSALSFRSDCVRYEQGLEAQYQQAQNTHSNAGIQIMQVAQVPAMYRDDVLAVYNGTTRARYGANGSQALLQAIHESNPAMDPALYRQVQQVIGVRRQEFAQSQQELLDRKREYLSFLATPSASLLNALYGFPHADMNRYEIVTTGSTQEAFRTHTEAPLDLRPTN